MITLEARNQLKHIIMLFQRWDLLAVNVESFYRHDAAVNILKEKVRER